MRIAGLPLIAALTLPLALTIWACGSDGPTQPSGGSGSGGTGSGSGGVQPAYEVSSFVSDVKSTTGAVGSRLAGSAPQPSNGPSSTPTGNASAINGGSNEVRIRSTAPFQKVYTFVGGVTGDVGGHWEVPLPAPTMDTSLVVSFGTQIPASNFDLVFGVASPGGSVGSYSKIAVQRIAAASGEVQVSVSWDARSDVDLHVVEPSGQEIYWGNASSSSGGQLDLDSNADCAIDNKNNENIRWTRAPGGTYRVLLDYWSGCGVAQSNYVVTIRNGGATQTFSGSFTGTGDQGAAGSGRPIASFNHVAALTAPEPVTSPLETLFPQSPFKRARAEARRAMELMAK